MVASLSAKNSESDRKSGNPSDIHISLDLKSRIRRADSGKLTFGQLTLSIFQQLSQAFVQSMAKVWLMEVSDFKVIAKRLISQEAELFNVSKYLCAARKAVRADTLEFVMKAS